MRNNQRGEQEDVGAQNADQMQLVVAAPGNWTGGHVARNGPKIKFNPEDETMMETFTDLCHLSKNRPMHMNNMAYGNGPGATEQRLVTRAKVKKLKFVIQRKTMRQRSQRTARASAKVWGFICGSSQSPQSTALVPYENRIPVRGGCRSTGIRQPLALTFGEDVELATTTTQLSTTHGRGGISVRGRGRPRAGRSQGRGQGRRGRGRIFSGALGTRKLDLFEGEGAEQLDVTTDGSDSRGTNTDGLGLPSRGRGRGAGQRARGRGPGRRGRGRGRVDTQRSSKVIETDEQQAVQGSSSTVGRGRRGRPKKTVAEPSLRGRGRGRRGHSTAFSATTSRKNLSDKEREEVEVEPSIMAIKHYARKGPNLEGSNQPLRGGGPGRRGLHRIISQKSHQVADADDQQGIQPHPTANGVKRPRGRPKKNVEPELCLRGSGPGRKGKNPIITQKSPEVVNVDTESTVQPSATAVQGGTSSKSKKAGLEPKSHRGRGRGTQNRSLLRNEANPVDSEP